MYYAEHGVPHFHALYSERTHQLLSRRSKVLAGSLPDRALRLVRESATLHRAEVDFEAELATAPQPSTSRR